MTIPGPELPRAARSASSFGRRDIRGGLWNGGDTVHLSRRRGRVSAIDASAEMVQIASIEDLGRIPTDYDAILSNFAAIDCIADPAAVAALFLRLVRLRGYAAVCQLNRVGAWRVRCFGLRFRLHTAFRRLRHGGVMSFLGVHVYYPSARGIRGEFEPAFELVQDVGVGALYEHLPDGAVGVAASLECWMCRLPLTRDAVRELVTFAAGREAIV
jgi:hypothetical protein